jgi:hypothetical protein
MSLRKRRRVKVMIHVSNYVSKMWVSDNDVKFTTPNLEKIFPQLKSDDRQVCCYVMNINWGNLHLYAYKRYIDSKTENQILKMDHEQHETVYNLHTFDLEDSSFKDIVEVITRDIPDFEKQLLALEQPN